MIDFIDLFSGIGGFRLGIEKAGSKHSTTGTWGKNHNGNEKRRGEQRGSRNAGGIAPNYYQCVWSCDNNKYANQVYTKQFGEENHYTTDIQGVDPEDIPDFDLLCSGFPCQAFSVAGKRKGFQDTRGTLFFEILRIARAKRPSLLLLENVKGLLNHDRGRTFTIILRSLDELGYWVEWQVLNSKYFGVPQNRERVFIVGHLRGTGGREIFPITESSEQVNLRNATKQIASALQSPGHTQGNYRGMNMIVEGMTLANTSRYKQGVNRTPIQSEGISWALNSAGDQGVAIASRPKGDFFLQHAIYNKKGLAPTLRGNQHDSSPRITDDLKIRRLTPVECERLQGFPDGWTEGLSDTQRYKCLGNAVTVNVIEFLGDRIMAQYTNNSTEDKL